MGAPDEVPYKYFIVSYKPSYSSNYRGAWDHESSNFRMFLCYTEEEAIKHIAELDWFEKHGQNNQGIFNHIVLTKESLFYSDNEYYGDYELDGPKPFRFPGIMYDCETELPNGWQEKVDAIIQAKVEDMKRLEKEKQNALDKAVADAKIKAELEQYKKLTEKYGPNKNPNTTYELRSN